MRISICHQALASHSGPDELDVLEQLAAVQNALQQLGHETQVVPCGLDLQAVATTLQEQRPERVFNLVESLADRGELIAAVPALLDTLGLPYTGCPAEALYLSSNKLLAKQHLRAAGLPTPSAFPAAAVDRFIVKSVWEHASRGMDVDSVLSAELVPDALRQRQARFGGRFFAEAYLHGREFNVALLAGAQGPRVLPIAEIAFEGLPPGAPHIVDYAAKWDPSSAQYHSTRRVVPAEAPDSALMQELAQLSLRCWAAFDLRGYARVDFRVTPSGQALILEVNANPCLAPDAGFAAALQRAGMSFQAAVAAILDDTGSPNHSATADQASPSTVVSAQ